ncbi:MAG: hypothetical protein JWO47_1006 [Candidatus Saccharibacteria bacterium]|nr:hypothetical protein [Candidatus Saccharibacteria bacterium]
MTMTTPEMRDLNPPDMALIDLVPGNPMDNDLLRLRDFKVRGNAVMAVMILAEVAIGFDLARRALHGEFDFVEAGLAVGLGVVGVSTAEFIDNRREPTSTS